MGQDSVQPAKRRARLVFFACLALLLVTEVGARAGLPHLARIDRFYDFRALRVLAEDVREGSSRVWLVGDSTVMGLDVGRFNTPGPVLDRALQERGADVDVRAVAVPGIGLDNIYEILSELPLQDGDLVLVSTHLGMVGNYRDDIGGARSLKSWQQRIERHLSTVIESSMLVRHRDYLSRLPALVAQTTLPQRLAYRLRRTPPGPQRREIWVHGQLGRQELAHLAGIYAEIGLGTAALAVEKHLAAHIQLQSRGVTLATYITPLNPALVEQYGYADWSTMVAAAAAICRDLDAQGVPCLDLVAAVPSEYFYDDDHLDAVGYRHLIEELVPLLLPRIE